MGGRGALETKSTGKGREQVAQKYSAPILVARVISFLSVSWDIWFMVALLPPRTWPMCPDTSPWEACGALTDLSPSLLALPIPASNRPSATPQLTPQHLVHDHPLLVL